MAQQNPNRVKLSVPRFGLLTLTTTLLTIGLIIYGGWVRVSGSGLGCPDWPLCEGGVIPNLDRETAIEFGHRLYAAITIGLTSLIAWIGFKRRDHDPVTAAVLLGALVVILVQAVLGGITVLTKLDSSVVTAHLIMGMVTLTLLTVGTVNLLLPNQLNGPQLGETTTLLTTMALLLVLGSLIVGTGQSAGCLRIPFCGEQSSHTAIILHTMHRSLAVLLLIGMILISIRIRSRVKSQLVTTLMHTIILIMITQMIAGAASVLLHLPTELRVVHLGLSTTIWWGIALIWAISLKASRTNG